MTDSPETPRTDLDLAYGDAVRKQLEHEDSLIVSRLSWLIASQSFLFTAYAITLNGPLQTRLPQFAAKQELVTQLVPTLALLSCILIYMGVIGGLRVMANLRRDLARHHAAAACVYRPPIQGSRLTLFLGHTAPVLLPPLFGAAWLALLTAH